MTTKFSNFFLTNLPITLAGTTLTAFLTVLPQPVEAISLVTNRANLGANDSLDWSSLGKVFNPFAPDPTKFLSNSFDATSQRGLGLNVNIPVAPPNTPPFVFQTLPFPQGIPTNFASGDFILFTGILPPPNPFPAIGNPGPLTITFANPVFAAGTQIAVDDALQPYTAFISAYDINNNLLGTFSTIASSSIALDNSAQFLGVRSDTANISKIVFSSSVPQRAFGINDLSIAVIPEPTSVLGTFALGTLGASWLIAKRRKPAKVLR
ncbi:PEP-CTERM sorting domain-containing protein [Merismopedia glauca]|uniref:PEP-CTERM sorting domain-containing protein n=1 Tax=Merismopedia glauca CCAP 1448/3 TaxID=1296344 RepID=A0A2T1C198_9CYAN|nr:PEP-CTERM sorting domain-containing protein [Merismopedia glauca]PSB02031.1 hypothetical protein C7B64_15140 [Merismopedia glauca CCAP 1448/3]